MVKNRENGQLFIILLIMFNLSGSEKNELKFIVIGDLGGMEYWPHNTREQLVLSKELAKFSDVDFVANVGDNFYWFGVKDVNDFRFSKFEKLFFSPLPSKKWYMVAGNHDYYGNVSAQILYSQRSKHWNFPDYFYNKVFRIPNSNSTLELVMLDTIILCSTHKESSIGKNDVVHLKGPMQKWLVDTLNKSSADYLIVLGHHGLYSVGYHGSSLCLQKNLEDLFEKYKVTAYFAGHDHCLQHIKKEKYTTHYFISGAGTYVRYGQPNYWQLGPNELRLLHDRSLGFWVLTANVQYLDVKLRVLGKNVPYSQRLRPRTYAEKHGTENTKTPPEKMDLLHEFFTT